MASRLSLASVGIGREPGSGGGGSTGSSRMGTAMALARGFRGLPGSLFLLPGGLPGFLFGSRATTSAGMGAGAAASSKVTLGLVFRGVSGISKGVSSIDTEFLSVVAGVSVIVSSAAIYGGSFF